jgi:ABC-type phosphate/phosphonate transport system substrate-binding protein
MSRIASLGMYDFEGLHAANDSLWRAIARRLRDGGIGQVPDALDRMRPLDEIWSDPNLLLAQACGYPLVTRFQDRLRYVATPRYRAVGCDGVSHRSRIVVRIDEPAQTLSECRGRKLAINDRASNTGMNLLRASVTPIACRKPFFGAVIETGAHAASVEAVAAGEADIAAIDNVTFAHLEIQMPAVIARLRTLGWTVRSPCPPFVTAASASDRTVTLLRRAIRGAIEDERPAADLLLLDRVDTAGAGRYDRLKRLEADARRNGYPDLV